MWAARPKVGASEQRERPTDVSTTTRPAWIPVHPAHTVARCTPQKIHHQLLKYKRSEDLERGGGRDGESTTGPILRLF